MSRPAGVPGGVALDGGATRRWAVSASAMGSEMLETGTLW